MVKQYLRLDGQRLLHLFDLLHGFCDFAQTHVEVQLLFLQFGALFPVQFHKVVDEVQVMPILKIVIHVLRA